MAMTTVERLAVHMLDTNFADIPDTAKQAARVFLMDTYAVGLAGSAAPGAEEIRSAAEQWGRGEDCHVMVHGSPLPAPSAALVNAYQIHCLEYDCVHEPAVVHAMSVITAAATAWAERRGGVSGDAFMAAIILGVDIAAGLGVSATSGLKFFRPATAGAFAAACAIARLEGFSKTQFADLLGLTYSQLSGTMQAHVEGSMALALQVAFAARAAVTAGDLVHAGCTGPHDVLDGPFGYFALFEDESDTSDWLNNLGKTWRISELSHKPFPTGRAAHGILDGLARLQAAHGFGIKDISQIKATVPILINRLVGRPYQDGMSVNYARLCLPFLVASALMDGRVDVPAYRPERLADPVIKGLAEKVDIVLDDNPDPNALKPQQLDITLTNGQQLSQFIPDVLGAPDNPLTREQQIEKLRGCARNAARPLDEAAQDRLIALCDHFEGIEDMHELVSATIP